MSTVSPNALTPKQLAKHLRQKCINLLEKITKNLFRMSRNEQTSDEQIAQRFFELYDKLSELKRVELYANYHRQMRAYIDMISSQLRAGEVLNREEQMTHLNRLQKLKNMSKYKKNKHNDIHQ